MLSNLKISTKLVGVIGVVAVTATLVVGWFVIRSAERALRGQIVARLEAERESRARLVSAYFERIHLDALVSAKLLVTQIALRDMPAALPTRQAPNGDYARLHALFDPIARGWTEENGYRDVFLIGVDGTVLYSSLKTLAVATNLTTNPRGGLSAAFSRAIVAPGATAHFIDFERSAADTAGVAAFLSAPVFDAGSKARLGVLAYEVPPDEIDAIMTDRTGFGDAGQTFLIGPDFMTRSRSRGAPMLERAPDTETVRRGLSGESGTIEHADPMGVRVLTSFAPIGVAGARWLLVAEADLEAALSPVRQFQSRLALLLMLVGLASAAALWMAMRRIVILPVAELAAGARRVAASDYQHPVTLDARDELGLLGESFNSMMASVGTQIDELKRAEEHVKESEERLAAAASGANLGLWDVEPDSGRTLTNPIFESQLGYPPGGLREGDDKWATLRGGLAGWVELLHPDDRAEVEQKIQQYLAGALDVYKAEHRVRANDGSYKWILSVGNSITRHEDGRPLRVNGVHIDIHEMKGLQLDLQLRYEELQRLQGLRDALVHMIVHDLRSPLTSVMGFIELLRKDTTATAEERMHFIDVAYMAATQMVEMIGSLLDINRLEAGEMPVDRQRVDLCEIAADAVQALSGLAIGRNLSQAAPQGPVMSNCDAALIRRVVSNLLGNALKFTPASGSITLTVSRVDGRPCVEVSDTGPGIPPDFIPRAFDKFSQAGAGRARKRYSTGLGLAFCKLAVEAHGGAIGVTSEVGVGSRFSFQLPE